MATVAAASAELLIIGWYIFRVLLQTLSPVRRRPAGNKDSGVRRSPAADDRDQGGVPGMLHLLGVQVLPAEAGAHGVPDRAAGAGGAQAASPQLRAQLPALGGHVIRCSCASRPEWEPVPRRNGGSPVLPRQRSTCQGQ
ncbi:neuronatin isoform X2 [Meriones unguiculatus]|uniref:neuronatin isoform X2 n=1 Tax=Meriones unguiculatus TaxID=10047 RepID=UPI00293EF3BD|nr:neuronatin isoform X2 [Meriones unguiculatus]